MNIMQSRRKIVLAGVLAIVFIGAVWIFVKWSSAHPSIQITTDSSPVNLEIADKKLVIKQSTTIRPPKGEYRYRAEHSGTVLYGRVDTVEGSEHKVSLNYKVFQPESVRKALCDAEGVSLSTCEYTPSSIKIKYLADHSWALISFTPPDEIAINSIALHLVNGKWVKVADTVEGPDDFRGSVPDFVAQEVL